MELLEEKDKYVEKKRSYRSMGLEYYTRSEEIVNIISHFTGGVFSLAAMIYMLTVAKTVPLVAASVLMGVFGAFPYFISAAYHAITDLKRKLIARRIDHSGVCFIVISCGAPLTLGMTIHTFDLIALALCVAIAGVNIFLALYDLRKFSKITLTLDLVVAAILTAVYFVNKSSVPRQATVSYIIGAVFCLAGLAFFGRKSQYMHSSFHLLMLAGTTACLHAGMYIIGL